MSQWSTFEQKGEKEKKICMEDKSPTVELFACLSNHEIFHRWRRTYKSDSTTNHNRKTRVADKEAPLDTRRNLGGNTFVRHFIILKPSTKTYKGRKTEVVNQKLRCISVSKLMHIG